jgi:uncharacterized protein (DUF4415 family)
MKKKWVDPDDAPPLTGDEVDRPDAKWRIGGQEVSVEEGKAAFRQALSRGKTRVNIHLDNDVIEHFKLKAGDRGYQTLINRALRAGMELKNDSVESVKDNALAEEEIARAIQSNADSLNSINKKLDAIASRLSMVAPSDAASQQNDLSILGFLSISSSQTPVPGTPPPRTTANNALHIVRERLNA